MGSRPAVDWLSKWLLPACFVFVFILVRPAFGAQIGIAQQDLFVFGSGNLVIFADTSDPSYISTLNSNNLGTFSWTYVNTTGTTLSNVNVFVFLDADIDRAINGAANEYGQVISQALPPGSAANAINWSSFQIDEPGFVSGTIFNNLLNGFLDNTNHVPPGTTNDVSLALGFSIGNLLPGQQTSGVFTISNANIGGLTQTDPDSNFTFYFNGYATAPAFGPVGASTPEPSTLWLVLLPLMVFAGKRVRKARLAIMTAPIADMGQPAIRWPLQSRAFFLGASLCLGAALPLRAQSNMLYVSQALGVVDAAGNPVTQLFGSAGNSSLGPVAVSQSDILGAPNNNVWVSFTSGEQATFGLGSVATSNSVFVAVLANGAGETGLLYGRAKSTDAFTFIGNLTEPDVGPVGAAPNIEPFSLVGTGLTQVSELKIVSTSNAGSFPGIDIQGLGVILASPPPVISNLITRFKDTSVDVSWASPSLFSNAGTISVCYYCVNNLGIPPTENGPVFIIQNSGTSTITGATLTINPPNAPTDSFLIGTIGPGNSFQLTPGVSNDYGTGHTFFAYTGYLRDTRDLGPNSDSTQFRMVGSEGGNLLDTGIFTPAATRSLSNDGTANTNFLGNENGSCNNCLGPKIVATLSLPNAAVSSYNLYRRTNGQTTETRIQSGLTGTFFEDTGLADGTTYYYTVRWVDPTGVESGDSTEMSSTPTSLASRVAHNTPPTILSNPVVLATAGSPYSYNVQASDPDAGDVLTYTLPTAPTGMTISSAGQISWAPLPSQAGNVITKVVVTDKKGNFASQKFQIVVQSAPPTAPPAITSNPVTSGAATQLYAYQVVATDPNLGAIITYSLIAAPAGMNITSNSGLAQWIPTAAQIGTQNVTIMVQDQFGLSSTQSYTITIGAAPIQNPVIISTPVTTASATLPYNYQVVASDPNAGQTLTYSLMAAPAGMTINPATGLIQWNPTVPQEGTQSVTVVATDGLGLTASQIFSISITAPILPPTVVITSPTPGQMITSMTNIVGSITDPNNGAAGQVAWTLGILKPGSSNYQTIASGTSVVPSGTIATIDPSLLPNNTYPLLLTVKVGNYVLTQNLIVNVTGGLKMGHFTLQYQDLAVPVTGAPLALLRRYDSLDSSPGDFGPGWRLGLPGQVTDSAYGQGFNTTTHVYVTLPTGTREGFTFNPTLTSPFFPVWLPAFTPDPGVSDTLSAPSDALFNSGGTFYDFSGLYNPTHFTLTTKYGAQYALDENAGLQMITFPNGNTLTFTAAGIISSTGVSIGFQRDGQNRITAIVDPNQHVIHYAYDTAGRLSQVTDENNNITTYVYQGTTNYLTTINAPGGCHPVTTQYDSAGRVSSTTDAAGNQTFHTYDPANRQSTLTNALNGVATFTYDSNGNTIQVTDASGTVNYTYDSNNNETSRTLPSGVTLSHTYDAHNNSLTATLTPTRGTPLTTSFTWTPQNLLSSVVYPSGKRRVFTYDSVGNLTGRQSQDSAGVVQFSETFTYDPTTGVQLTKTDGLANTTNYTYDSFSDLASVTDATGVVYKYTHDANGNVISKTDGLGNTLNLAYDAANNLASITVAGESTPRSSFTYDSQNKLASYTDGNQKQTTYAQSCTETLSSVTDPLGNKTSYSYNGLLGLTSAVDANSHTTSFTYDTANRFLSRSDPDGTTAAYTYNPDSVQQTVTTPTAGITRSFDSYGSLAQEVQPEKTINYAYDVDRNLIQTTETSSLGTRTTTYTYDGANHVASITDWQNRTASFTYNLRGQTATVQSPDGATTTYAYDNAGRMLKVQTGTDFVQYAYDAAGRRIQAKFSNGVTTNYTYDVFSRITGIVTKDSSANVIASYVYMRDANENVTSVILPDGQINYTYDADQRLTEDKAASLSLGAYDHLFPYDAVGNRLDGNASYNAGNRLTSNSGVSFSYDNSGNRTGRGTQRYGYDSLNRLVSYSGTRSATYEYNSTDDRVAKTVNGIRREFVYWGNKMLDEYQGGVPVARYTFGQKADEVLFVRRNGQTYFYHADALGSIVAITDSTGHLVQKYGYDAWGNLLVNSGSFSFSGTGLVNDFTFTGREYDDESSLYYMRARTYDPSVGSFLQKDALQGKLHKPLTQNRYAYVSGNPTNLTDPTGNEELTETALILDSASEKGLFAFIGYIQGYAITQLDFVGNYLGFVNETEGGGDGLGDTPLDASQIWQLAYDKTKSDLKNIKDSINAKDFPDETQGVVGAYLDGVTANDLVTDFNKAIELIGGPKLKDFKDPPSYGGFAQGTDSGLNYLQGLAPQE